MAENVPSMFKSTQSIHHMTTIGYIFHKPRYSNTGDCGVNIVFDPMATTLEVLHPLIFFFMRHIIILK